MADCLRGAGGAELRFELEAFLGLLLELVAQGLCTGGAYKVNVMDAPAANP